jgi:hypothetical protein
LNGSYLSLRGGFAHEALQDLTGCPTLVYDMTSSSVESAIESSQFWVLMKKYLSKGYIMSGSTFGEEDLVESDFIMNTKRH